MHMLLIIEDRSWKCPSFVPKPTVFPDLWFALTDAEERPFLGRSSPSVYYFKCKLKVRPGNEARNVLSFASYNVIVLISKSNCYSCVMTTPMQLEKFIQMSEYT